MAGESRIHGVIWSTGHLTDYDAVRSFHSATGRRGGGTSRDLRDSYSPTVALSRFLITGRSLVIGR